MEHPISGTYLDQQVAKIAAALPAAGAWDTPIDLACPGFSRVTLYLTYTRGGAAGACDFKIEVSPESSGTNWHQTSQYAPAVLAAGADSQSREQREYITYQATAAGAELFVFGPVELDGTVERLRVTCRESGNVGAPGTLGVKARFA
jgi:hypothetical protein